VNSWRDQSVRLALAPLHALADRQRCAVVVIVHLNKALSSEPLRRIGGSVGIPAAARSVLLLARDPDDDGDTRRVLAHVKCNLGPSAPSLLYQLDPILLPAMNGTPEVETVRLLELGESEHQGSALLSVSSSGDAEERSAQEDAREFLRVELGDGARPAKAIRRAAGDSGISSRTLDRAKTSLGVRSEREGGIAEEGKWLWRLPEASTKDAQPLAQIEHEQPGVLSENGSAMPVGEHDEFLSTPSLTHGALNDSPEGDDPAQDLLDYYRSKLAEE